MQYLTEVTEAGLYTILIRSKLPAAKPFRRWVTHEVLPAIRQDGMYVAGEEKVRTGEMSEDELILKAMGFLQRKTGRSGSLGAPEDDAGQFLRQANRRSRSRSTVQPCPSDAQLASSASSAGSISMMLNTSISFGSSVGRLPTINTDCTDWWSH